MRVAILLGSNIAPERNVPRAVRALRAIGTPVAVGDAWQAPPADGASGPDFRNAAVLLDTVLEPAALKRRLRAIERWLGRTRPAPRHAPRPIDLDVAGRDGTVGDEARRHAYVAVPLADVAPGWHHAATGETVHALARRLRGTARLRRLGHAGR